MTDGSVLVDRVDDVAHVVLNRPERRNALNESMVRRLEAVLVELECAEWCRAVVLAGTGKAFCAGGDLDDNAPPNTDAVSALNRHRGFLSAARRLMVLPKPTVAAVHGAAIGAGASLALLCDEVVLGADARLGFGFLAVGLPPDTLSVQTVQRRAGWTVATDLFHTGRLITAPEAVSLRLAHRVADGSVLDAATARAMQLARLSPFAFAATKAMLRQAWLGGGLEELEGPLVGIAVATPEFRAATERFRAR
jgi:2-(1,2-epoxy-1,2-dihydrophenyl)acetyl-CoA isomerase